MKVRSGELHIALQQLSLHVIVLLITFDNEDFSNTVIFYV